MKKKFNIRKPLSLLLALCLCMGLLPATALAEDGDFTIKDGVLVQYEGPGGDVVIPDGVTSIGDMAFSDCTSLTSVTIPSSVTSIEKSAFSSCKKLTSVTIPNSVASIGDWAFSGCSSLKSVTIPGSVTSIGPYTFKSCTDLTSVTIPEGVISIGEYAFSNCKNLTSVTIPSSVTSIETQAFINCTSLTDVTIEKGITDISNKAFFGCKDLTSVTIPSSVTSIGKDVFPQGCTLKGEPGSYTDRYANDNGYVFVSTQNSDFAVDGTTLKKYLGPGGSVTIPSSVTSIEDRAFYNCKSLTSVTIPSSVTTIGKNAFQNCTGLTSVTIPSSITSIGIETFYGCTSLVSITIPSSVTSIGDNAFYGCTDLTSVTISSGVTSIGASAFYSTSIAKITVPSSVTKIGNVAFPSGCILQGELGSYVERYANEPYSASGKPRYTFVSAQNPEFSVDGATLKKYLGSADTVTIPDGITKIGKEAFRNTEHTPTITKVTGPTKVIVPASVTDIDSNAFRSGCILQGEPGGYLERFANYHFCYFVTAKDPDFAVYQTELKKYVGSSKTVVIPNGITSIGKGAFAEYTDLTSVKIPSSVTSIGDNAFIGCTGLTSVVIPSGVTTIGGGAFKDCTGLTSLTIPSNVTTIGGDPETGGAFEGCKNLTDLTISKGVTKIDWHAFYRCTGLTSVTIPGSITSLEWDAFALCTGLTSVTIEEGATWIGYGIFSGCTNLTSITIPSSITSMGLGICSQCPKLTDVYFGGNEEQWKTLMSNGMNQELRKVNVHYGKSSNVSAVPIENFKIESNVLVAYNGPGGAVTIPDGVVAIGIDVFRNRADITSVRLPVSVISIDSRAFYGCTSMTEVYYNGNAVQWSRVNISKNDNAPILYTTVYFIDGNTMVTRPPDGAGTQQPARPTGPQSAMPTNDKLTANGVLQNPTVYKINDSNYFKIRDLAAILNGTEKQFAVGYDGTLKSVTAIPGRPYELTNTELAGAASGNSTAEVSNDTIYVNGVKVEVEVYKINGSNYFKLRDLGKTLNFYVGWTAGRGMYIETDKPYSE